MVESCCTDDLLPNVPISCLPASCVDPKVQGLKVIIDCPQPGSSPVTYRPSPLGRWSKCSCSDMVMILLRSGASNVPKETRPEWLETENQLTEIYLFVTVWKVQANASFWHCVQPAFAFGQQSCLCPTLPAQHVRPSDFFWLSGTRRTMTCGIQSVLWRVTDSHWRRFYFCSTNV